MNMLDMEIVLERILTFGPTRIIINSKGDGVPTTRTHVRPDIIFVRDDGWTVGAPHKFEEIAYNLWKDRWVAYFRRGAEEVSPIRDYTVRRGSSSH